MRCFQVYAHLFFSSRVHLASYDQLAAVMPDFKLDEKQDKKQNWKKLAVT
jgi:hypothetical protein